MNASDTRSADAMVSRGSALGIDYRRGDAERLQCLYGLEAAMDEISGTGEHNGRPIRLGAADHLIAALPLAATAVALAGTNRCRKR